LGDKTGAVKSKEFRGITITTLDPDCGEFILVSIPIFQLADGFFCARTYNCK